MPLTGNKGEWSELYAFFKLLADGKLYSGDGHLRIHEDRFYPILKIFRNDAPDRVEYTVNAGKRAIFAAGKQTTIELSQDLLADKARELLDFIRSMETSTAACPKIEEFMHQLECSSIKAKSSDKADIRIVIHDLRTGTKPELGYSIKSQLGGSPTLINANRDGTNFVYEVRGVTLDKATMGTINAQRKFKRKFELLRELGAQVDFVGVASSNLANNLTMLDTCLPRLMGECLLLYYSSQARKLDEVEQALRLHNPLGFDVAVQPLYYEYKLKQCLLAFALGMTASKLWDGRFNANGGSIVVKESGEIVCYHFFDRNEFEEYLFRNTIFDTPSTTRHCFGQLYEEDGKVYLKLNLQVRFC